jgi:DNA replication protein DnaC
VLLLDDLGLSALTEPEGRDLLEIIEDRYGVSSTIITSQLPVSAWHDFFGGSRIADAICDRLLHNAFRIELTSTDSGRKLKAAAALTQSEETGN